MSSYRTKNQIVAAAVETTPGDDAAPTVGSNAVRVKSPKWSGGPESLANDDETTGALTVGAPIGTGGGAGLAFGVNIKGPGAAGAAPEYGVFWRGCAMAQTLTASAVANTAQAGGPATITLHSGSSATNSAYKGMVIQTTGGTGDGQTRVILGYVGSTKVATVTPAWTVEPDNTTTYSIRANALYVPASTSLKTLSIYNWKNRADGGLSRLRKLLGAAGTWRASLPVRGIPVLDFQFGGKFVKPIDVSAPGVGTFQPTTARPIIGVDCFVGDVETRFNQFTLDYGGKTEQADDPGDAYGIDVAAVVGRALTGRINPPVDLLSVRDTWQAFIDGDEEPIWLNWGSVAGNRVSALIPRALYTGAEDEDVKGFAHEGIPFAGLGEDAEIYWCIW